MKSLSLVFLYYWLLFIITFCTLKIVGGINRSSIIIYITFNYNLIITENKYLIMDQKAIKCFKNYLYLKIIELNFVINTKNKVLE